MGVFQGTTKPIPTKSLSTERTAFLLSIHMEKLEATDFFAICLVKLCRKIRSFLDIHAQIIFGDYSV